jgi:hypothetical protein
LEEVNYFLDQHVTGG